MRARVTTTARYIHDSLLRAARVRRVHTRRYAEVELRINNSYYKAFRYGDIDYAHRLCGPKVSEDDDDDVTATAAADVTLHDDTMKIMITRERTSGGRVRRADNSLFGRSVI